MSAELHAGDGVAALARACGVDLVLCDLPSGETAAPCDTPIDLPALWLAVDTALAPAGNVVLMAHSFVFAARVVASRPGWFRYDLIWHKSIATGFLNAASRPLRAHEHVLVFHAGAGHYAPDMQEGATPIHRARGGHGGKNYGAVNGTESRAGATDRYPTSVLQYNSVGTTSPERVHPQQKPTDLMRALVRMYCPPGGVVFDPCAGSGSAVVSAHAEGRHGIGYDLLDCRAQWPR